MRKRIIVKIGTKVITKENGRINNSVLGNIAEQIAELKNNGVDVVLVTSGAVACGRGFLRLGSKKESVADKQVFAAIGQVKLMETYAKFFAKRGYLSAQVLVTKEDFRDPVHYQNMRRCFLNLFRDGVIPIVNENDTVAIRELMFTDNDELTGLVAVQLGAGAVVILTSNNGFYDGNPSDKSAKLVSEINRENIVSLQGRIVRGRTTAGRGGMMTKFAVAKKLAAAGIAVYIANGVRKNVLRDILAGHSIGTKFVPFPR